MEKNNNSSFTRKKTQGVRHFFVKLLAPRIYEAANRKATGIRPMTEFISKRDNLEPLVGIEVGVDRAENSKTIFETLPIKMLYIIDPYLPYEQDGLMIDNSENYKIAQETLKPYSDRTTFLKMTSLEAAKQIPDNVDFVYIDGCHCYDCVTQDIATYYPKVKTGGVIGGHDFWSECIGVCKAVFEFVDKEKKELNGKATDWWIEK